MEKPTKVCEFCHLMFEKKATTSRARWSEQRFCSWPCRATAVGVEHRGVVDSDETRLKKSLGKIGALNPQFGKKQTAETIAKRSSALIGKTTNEKHRRWKGDDVGYLALHQWLNRKYPKTLVCERCGERRKMTHYANIIGHQYTRRREDYQELCIPCHHEIDGRKRDSMTGRFIPMCAT